MCCCPLTFLGAKTEQLSVAERTEQFSVAEVISEQTVGCMYSRMSLIRSLRDRAHVR